MLRQLVLQHASALRCWTARTSGPSTASTSYLARSLSSTAFRLDRDGNHPASPPPTGSNSDSSSASDAPVVDATEASRAVSTAEAEGVPVPHDTTSTDLASSPPPSNPTTRSSPTAPSLDDILSSTSTPSSPPLSLPGSSTSTDSDPSPLATTFRPTPAPTLPRPRIRTRNPLLDPPAHALHIRTSRNNTILTLASPLGDPLASASGGSVGFKKSARSGYEAGYRAAFRLFGQIAEKRDAWRIHSVEVFWNGFGQGREAVYRALLTGEGAATRALVAKMTDKTPVKVGGVRPKKRRML